MVRHLRDDAPHLTGELFGTAFDHAIQATLQKQPEDRIGSAKEILALLNTAEADLPAMQVPTVGPPEASNIVSGITIQAPPSKAQRARWTVLLALLGLIAASLLWLVFFDSKLEPVDLVGVSQTAQETQPQTVAANVVVPTTPDVGVSQQDLGFEFDEDAGEPDVVASPVHKPKEPKKKVEDTPDKVEMVTFRVGSTPADATVTFDGVLVGNTPLKRQVKVGDKVVRVRVSHVGYKHEVFELIPDQDQEVNTKLDYERIKMF